MSTKKSKIEYDPKTGEVILPPQIDLRSANQRLTSEGSEIVSDKSRVVAAHLPTLGERIRRYQRSPQMQSELLHNPEYWDDDDKDVLEMVESRTSVHEVRYQNGLKKAAKVKAKRDDDEKKAAAQREADEKKRRREEIRAAIKEGEISPEDGQ